ncbi:uncharacterized protein LOC142980856 isoform X2 [Anticarsia gemmatalis]
MVGERAPPALNATRSAATAAARDWRYWPQRMPSEAGGATSPAASSTPRSASTSSLVTISVSEWPVGAVLNLNTGYTITESTPAYLAHLEREMKLQNGGPFTVGIDELLALVIDKEALHLQSVVVVTEDVFENVNSRNGLWFLGSPMWEILFDIVTSLSVMTMDSIKAYARILRQLVHGRHELLSGEVNHLLDLADSLVTDQDGDRLFNALTEFKGFPTNSSKTNIEMCQEVFDSFRVPFFKISKTDHGIKLMSRANRALHTRFPHIHQMINAGKRRSANRRTTSGHDNNGRRYDGSGMTADTDTTADRHEHYADYERVLKSHLYKALTIQY